MKTISGTLAGTTPTVILTGRFVIRQITLTATAAATLDAYDSANTSKTQSNAAYSNKARTDPYTRTRAAISDILGNANDFTYTGIGDAANTVALNASYPKPKQDSLSIPAAGQQIADNRLSLTQGLMLEASAAATYTITYEPLL